MMLNIIFSLFFLLSVSCLHHHCVHPASHYWHRGICLQREGKCVNSSIRLSELCSNYVLLISMSTCGNVWVGGRVGGLIRLTNMGVVRWVVEYTGSGLQGVTSFSYLLILKTRLERFKDQMLT